MEKNTGLLSDWLQLHGVVVLGVRFGTCCNFYCSQNDGAWLVVSPRDMTHTSVFPNEAEELTEIMAFY